MIVSTSLRSILKILVLSLALIQSSAIQASSWYSNIPMPTLVSGLIIMSGAVFALVHNNLSSQVARVDTRVGVVEQEVKKAREDVQQVRQEVQKAQKDIKKVQEHVEEVQKTQKSHTQEFGTMHVSLESLKKASHELQDSSNKNFQGVAEDLDALRERMEQRIQELHDALDKGHRGLKEDINKSQQEVVRSVDSVRGFVDRRTEELGRQIAALEALLMEKRGQLASVAQSPNKSAFAPSTPPGGPGTKAYTYESRIARPSDKPSEKKSFQ